MRISLCCKAPAAIHGARRRQCRACGRTWSIRPRKRGRKPKRLKKNLAEKLLREKLSSRGLAKSRHISRETMRRQIYRSFAVWKKTHGLPAFPRGKLVAVLDAMWFKFKKDSIIRRFTSYLVLLRPINENTAVIAKLTLRPGKESKTDWQMVLSELPKAIQKNIKAIVMDGNTGIMRLSEERGWHFQWCHAHIKRKVWELRGARKVSARIMRQHITGLVYRFLETSSNKEAEKCIQKLKSLFAHPNCPKSFPRRLSGLIRRSSFFRMYRNVPELNLPVTTNSAEQVHSRIRERWSTWRGTRTPGALAYWLDIFQREIKQVRCRGFKETLKSKIYHRISVS